MGGSFQKMIYTNGGFFGGPNLTKLADLWKTRGIYLVADPLQCVLDGFSRTLGTWMNCPAQLPSPWGRPYDAGIPIKSTESPRIHGRRHFMAKVNFFKTMWDDSKHRWFSRSFGGMNVQLYNSYFDVNIQGIHSGSWTCVSKAGMFSREQEISIPFFWVLACPQNGIYIYHMQCHFLNPKSQWIGCPPCSDKSI